MNSSYIKTYLIILLAAANIFLAVNIYQSFSQRASLPQDMLQNASDLLEKSGLYVEPHKIPNNKLHNSIFEGEFSQALCEQTVKRLSGTDISDPFTTPSLDNNSYIIKAGEYSYRFSETLGYKMDTTEFTPDDALSSMLQSRDNNGSYEHNIKAFEKVKLIVQNYLFNTEGQHSSYRLDFSAEIPSMNGTFVRVVQTVDGLDINAHWLCLFIRNDKVIHAQGCWYFGDFIGKYDMELMDAVNVLFHCVSSDNPVSGQITDISLLYGIIWHESTKFYLLPSWHLNMDDGSSIAYNSLTGDKMGT